MSITYTKLLSSITESTVWYEPDATRLVWITMLAMADRNGRVWASIPGLAGRARVSSDACRTAIACFLAPDPDSRTKEHEGRRIEEIDGGWHLLNHTKYRELRDTDERQAYQREWIANKRRQQKSPGDTVDDGDNVDISRPQSTQAAPAPAPSADPEKNTDTEELSTMSTNSTPAAGAPTERISKRRAKTKSSAVPISEFHAAVVGAYREICSMLPRVEVWTKQRRELLEALIQERRDAGKPADTVQYWRGYFENVAASDFLCGQKGGWRADFEWLLNPNSFRKVMEGNYANNTNGKSRPPHSSGHP
jgi:hypothetical protein